MVAGRHFNLLALACICATFVVVDGPLLQRASTVRLRVPQPLNLGVSIAPEMPAYHSGWSIYKFMPKVEGLTPSTEFLPVMRDYASGIPIRGGISGCPGSCTASVRGPALAIDHCISKLDYINYTEPVATGVMQLFDQGCLATPRNRVIFDLNFLAENGSVESITFVSMRTDSAVAETCVGHLNTTTCTLVSAIGEYDVLVTNNSLSFLEPPSSPTVIARANNTAITDETVNKYRLRANSDGLGVRTTLSGIAAAAGYKYQVSEAILPASATGQNNSLLPGPNWLALKYIANFAAVNDGQACSFAWNDPHDDVMAFLNELMFRSGVHAAQYYGKDHLESLLDPGLETHYNVTGSPKTPETVFESNFTYFAIAATIELFTIIIITFNFYGWWRLGRSTSFSPLEIAKASHSVSSVSDNS